jgi:hypothetical protein
VAVGLSDGADRDLSDLRAAPHDDDPLAVHLVHRGHELDRVDAVDLQEGGLEGLLVEDGVDLPEHTASFAALQDLDGPDVAVVGGDGRRHVAQQPSAVHALDEQRELRWIPTREMSGAVFVLRHGGESSRPPEPAPVSGGA